MQFSQVIFAASIIASAAALPQLGLTQAASSQGSCSTGTAQCCSTVKSGNDAESFVGLLGLNSIAGAIGLGCQQIPINVIGVSAAAQNQCKNTAVCCNGSHANGLIQAACTPLSVN